MPPASEDRRIVFVGAERVGYAVLSRLFEENHNVVGVVTADESRRDDIADWVPFDDLLEGRDVQYYKVSDSNTEEFSELVIELNPDVVLVISWSFIIPSAVLNHSPQGVVGLHYSLLPERRGGAPLNWALIDGLNETGISLFYMEEELDTGDVTGQRRIEIERDDTVKDLLDEIIDVGPELVAEFLPGILDGTAPRHEQDESAATYTEPRTPADSIINWDQPLRELYDFIRALSPPYRPAFTPIGDYRLVVPSASFAEKKLQIEGYFEQASSEIDDRGNIVNATAGLENPEALAAEIRNGYTSEPVDVDVNSRAVRLTNAHVRDGMLHVWGVVQ